MSAVGDEYALARQLHGQGRLVEAAAAYARVLETVPDFAEGHLNWGAALHALGRLDEAAEHYQRSIELRPDLAEAHNNLGKAFHDCGLLDKAIDSYRFSLRLKPKFADSWYNLGTALSAQQKYSEAAECLRKAIELRPDYADAYCRLGVSLNELARLREAEWSSQRTVEADSNSAVARQLFNDAERAYTKAIALDSNSAEAYHNLGLLFNDTGRFQEAGAAYRAALALKPDLADTHWSLGNLLLLQGNLTDGWPEFEWRWKCDPFKSVGFAGPLWDGQNLAGKTILLRAEQGFGDMFQFIRYAKPVKGLAAKVVVVSPAPIQRLLATCPGVDQVCSDEDEPPLYDFESTLMTLPGIFGTTLDSIPADFPYLFADGDLVGKWHAELADVAGFRIGINWHGRTGRGHFQKRDIPFDLIAQLGESAGVSLMSLLRGAHEELDQDQREMVWLPDAHFDKANGAFMDTAAIIMNLDLVITSDTAIAHLAGALHKPVWVLLPYVPDWRWMLKRSDSPWYPTMRLFRQPSPGNWCDAFTTVREEFKSLLSAHSGVHSSKI